MRNLIIGIGRNVSPKNRDPERDAVSGAVIPAPHWINFQRQVEFTTEKRGGKVISIIIGQSHSPEWGVEEGAWFAVEFDGDDFDLYCLKTDLARLAQTYGQDAIAVTTGTTEFVERPEQVRADYVASQQG